MCEAKDGLHIVEDQILVEVVDPVTGEVLPEGEQGEIVFTSLRKQARPMIRFRSKDIGYITKEKCSCGRTSTRMYITGRLDDMFIVSGVNVFPSDVECAIRQSALTTGEYRITLYNENYTTRYKIEVERGCESYSLGEVAQDTDQILRTRLGVRPREVTVLEKGILPRATHKARRIIDLREEKLVTI